MSLKTDAKEKLKALGMDVEALITAITAAEEVDYIVPEGSIIKAADLEARDANKVAEGKKLGQPIGETIGRDLAAKALKKRFGIEDDTKDIEKVVELVNAKVGAGDAGLKEQVQLLLKDKETLTVKAAEAQKAADNAVFDTELISMFPADRTGDLNDKERLTLIKSTMSFEASEGKRIVKVNGEVLRDATTQSPVETKKAIADYFTERKWSGPVNADGGRGGGDNSGKGGTAGVKTLSQAQEQWKKENPTLGVMSPEFSAYTEKIAKDNPDFNFYA